MSERFMPLLSHLATPRLMLSKLLHFKPKVRNVSEPVPKMNTQRVSF
jgi:hypothetical protein